MKTKLRTNMAGINLIAFSEEQLIKASCRTYSVSSTQYNVEGYFEESV
jgi:hypothetical protein